MRKAIFLYFKPEYFDAAFVQANNMNIITLNARHLAGPVLNLNIYIVYKILHDNMKSHVFHLIKNVFSNYEKQKP